MKPRKILKRIKSIERTQKITHAMEIVASIQLKKLEEVFLKFKSFHETFNDIMREFYFYLPKNFSDWFNERQDNNYFIVIIGSDRGLCGAFNANLLQELSEKLKEWQNKKIIDIMPVGRKCSYYCSRKFKKEGITNFYNKEEEIAQDLAEKVIQLYKERKVDNVIFLYTRYRGHSLGKFSWEKVLPIVFPPQEKQRNDYIIEPAEEGLINRVIPEYIKSKIIRIMLESRSSEELSRMLAMRYATDNAKELIDELHLKYYRARQTQITRELLDIVQASGVSYG
jgi:F-type H+-transporting ATPase subunit gamma